HPLRFLAVQDAVEREVFHFTRESRLVVGRVKACDGPSTRLPFEQVAPTVLDVVPDRRYDTGAGHEHSRALAIHAVPLSLGSRKRSRVPAPTPASRTWRR